MRPDPSKIFDICMLEALFFLMNVPQTVLAIAILYRSAIRKEVNHENTEESPNGAYNRADYRYKYFHMAHSKRPLTASVIYQFLSLVRQVPAASELHKSAVADHG